MGENLYWHKTSVTRADRESVNGHRGCILWFTGLSGAGKSTIAHALEHELFKLGCKTYVFDGDNVRHGLCSDLGFSAGDRHENIRRIGEMLRLFLDAGMIALAAFVSPYRADRELLRSRIGGDDFLEIYCHCPVQVCEQRDRKGIYRRARAGEIPEFTGISAPYEEPEAAQLTLDTAGHSLEDCVAATLRLLRARGVISAKSASAPVA
jgi:adenylylsulfate kinase